MTEALLQQGLWHLRQGQYQDAIACCEQYLAETPSSTVGYGCLGLAWLLAGEVEQAVEVWLTILTSSPDVDPTPTLVHLLTSEADGFLYRKQPTLAAAIYTQLLDLDAQPHVCYQLGRSLAQMGQLDEAIAQWQHAVDLQPQWVAAHYAQAEAWQRLENFEAAIDAFSAVLVLDPNRAEARYNLGRCLIRQQRWQKAIACFEEICHQSAAAGELAYIYLHQKNLKQATTCLRQAVRYAPEFVDSYCQWVANSSPAHLVSPSLQTNARLLAALRINPQSSESYIYLGILLSRTGNGQGAIAAFQQALLLHPDCQTGLFELAKCWADEGDDRAIKLFQQIVEQQPASPVVYVELGKLWARKKQFDLAINAYNQALVIDPNDENVWLRLGQSLSAIDRWDDAVDHYQTALRLNSNSLESHYHLGLALIEVGQKREGIDALQTAMMINSGLAKPVAKMLEIFCAQSKLDQTELQSITPMDAPTAFAISRGDRSDEATVTPIRAKTTVPLTSPSTCDETLHFSFCFGSEIELPQTFVASVPNGRFWLDPDQSSLGIITANNQLLADLSVEFPILSPGNNSHHHWLLVAEKVQLPKYIDATVVVLSALSNDVYFHWMVDVLPRIELLKLAGINLQHIDYFLVSRHLPFQAETLSILGIPQQKLLSTNEHLHLHATTLIVPSFSGSAAWMSPQACQFIRQSLIEQINNNSTLVRSPSVERIYVSRGNTSTRRLINEREVISLLRRYGFQVVTLEALSVLEQVALFSKAEVIIAPHGSGLTNLLFCNPQTKVIEIFSPNYVYPCYWYLANLVGLKYYYLLGNLPLGFDLNQLLHPNPRIEDIFVDLNSLINLLKLAEVMDK